MPNHEPTDEQLCRLNGQKPTLRQRWTAFYRLYRLSMRHGAFQEMAVVDCFRVMFADWGWIRLVEAKEDGVSRNHMPKFIRRTMIQYKRKKRLHGDHPEFAERDRATAALVREQHGMEVTPDEVAGVRNQVVKMAREKALEMGISVPDDDLELQIDVTTASRDRWKRRRDAILVMMKEHGWGNNQCQR